MTVHPAPPLDPWAWLQACNETWLAGAVPASARQLREARLAALLESAIGASPFYRRRAHGPRLEDFAPVGKSELMQEFDDWATDRAITRRAAASFLADPSGVGDAWLGKYLLWTSSGTSGVPGWFVQDAHSLAAYDAIDALRLRHSARGGPFQAGLGSWGLGQRFAFVGASGGHFAGVVSMQRLSRIVPPAWRPAIHVLSAQQPLRRIVDQLQALQPTVLITYPSCAAALAQAEQESALGLRLSEVWLGGEQLSAGQRRLIGAAFACPVRNSYGASEFFSMAFECAEGRLHVNDDWVILEPVDEQSRPVPDGSLSHTLLLTNLANRTQPLIRYRLEDRICRLTTRCRCGSAFTSIEVQGRSADTLTLRDARRRAVTILPLALETAIEEGAQVTQFQVIGQQDGHIELRFEAAVPDARAAFGRCREAIDAFLAEHGVTKTRVQFNPARPVHGRASGKLRRVISA
jgi:phenylacetate-CoA ligase